MSELQQTCDLLHRLAWGRERFHFPYDAGRIPNDGIYLLFEVGEMAHGGSRIVRVGTHTGKGQLRPRLRQHFMSEAKDRSIFRKNIGRCLLAMRSDPYSWLWELDLTSKAARASAPPGVSKGRQSEIEQEVSATLRTKFSFVVVPVAEKESRLKLESGIIALLHACAECAPTTDWLGRFSPKSQIRESGLWQVSGLHSTPLELDEVQELMGRCDAS